MSKTNNSIDSPEVTVSEHLRESSRRHSFALLIVGIVVIFGIGYIIATKAATSDSLLSSIEGETMTPTAPAATAIISDSNASGGKALAIYGKNTVYSKEFTISDTATSVKFIARGDQCNGAPYGNLRIDGKTVGTPSVSNTNWATFTYPIKVSAGTHKVSFVYSKDVKSSTCDRSIFIDNINLNGNGASQTDTTTPSVPANLTLKLNTNNQPVLSWGASTDNVGVAGYEIWRRNDPGTEWSKVGQSSSTSYTDSSVAAGSSYAYGVHSIDGAGNTSNSSNIVSIAIPSGTTTPPPPPTPTGGTIVRSDDGTKDVLSLWGSIDCQSTSRLQKLTEGSLSFRRTTALDGDDFYGERCEVGKNTWKYGVASSTNTYGTFYLYKEGEHATTSYMMRLPSSFPTSTTTWQVVTQMKQTKPYVSTNFSPGDSPVISLAIERGNWHLKSGGNEKYSGPVAQTGVWIPVKIDVIYSKDPNKGKVQLTIGGTVSPIITMQTLAFATASGDGLNVGDPIPSHLRIGVYHNPTIAGTSVDFTNVVVTKY